MPTPLIDPRRIADVLADMAYPARTWQLIAQADHYGADRHTRSELRRLPAARYTSLESVLSALRDSHRATAHIFPGPRSST